MKLERIKQMREDHDFTQQFVADYLNISRSAYSNYENDTRGLPCEILCDLAELYHTSTDYLLGRTDNPRAPQPTKAKYLYLIKGK